METCLQPEIAPSDICKLVHCVVDHCYFSQSIFNLKVAHKLPEIRNLANNQIVGVLGSLLSQNCEINFHKSKC